MDKYSTATDNIANFWEVQLLQQHGTNGNGEQPSEEFNGTVGPVSTLNITSGIDDDATVVISNTGSVPLLFCSAPDGTSACTIDTSIALGAGETTQATGAELNTAGSFLNVTNNDPGTEGSYSVEIMPGES
jgi:hypothetical protein